MIFIWLCYFGGDFGGSMMAEVWELPRKTAESQHPISRGMIPNRCDIPPLLPP
jgi:hypothetical protein